MRHKEDPLLSAFLTITSPILAISWITFYIGVILSLICLVILSFIIFCCYVKYRILSKKDEKNERIIAFFHPYCDAGGGGERVLWCGIRAIQKKYPAEKLFIYTGDLDSAPDQIISRAKQRFDIEIQTETLEFVYLHRRKWVEADMWPRFTLLGQSLGSIFLALEALDKVKPDVFLDTMGYAFTLLIFKYLGNFNFVHLCFVYILGRYI